MSSSSAVFRRYLSFSVCDSDGAVNSFPHRGQVRVLHEFVMLRQSRASHPGQKNVKCFFMVPEIPDAALCRIAGFYGFSPGRQEPGP